MAEEPRVSRAVVVSATPLPQAAGPMLHWDGSSSVCCDVEPSTVSVQVPQSSFQAKGPPATAHQARPYWTTGEICLVPAFPPQAIAWEKEAALMTFALAPTLLLATATPMIPRATGELVWVAWQEKTESPILCVHPVLLGHAPYESLQTERITIVPSLQAHDPLLHHMILVLQAAVTGKGETGRLYAEVLADALLGHFLRRYVTAPRALGKASGGLAPYKLQRTLAYIQAHLEQALSLTTLADVAQTSRTHFARLFKHTTGVAPHQYVTLCRMEHAKRLLAETDWPLVEIAHEVGCADQSHFTALFRAHSAMTPKAYRDRSWRA